MLKNQQKFNLELTSEQYSLLLDAFEMGQSIYGIMGDMVDERYKIRSEKMEQIGDYLIANAENFDCGDKVEEFDGQIIINDKNSNRIMEELHEYDEYNFWDELVNRLSVRDLYRKYGAGGVKVMSARDRITAQMEIEEGYWKEVEENGVENITINKKYK